MPYKILEHPSDIGISVECKSLSEAFIESTYALYKIIFGEKSETVLNKLSNDEAILEVEGNDEESLFVNYLNELLFFLDSEKALISVSDVLYFSDKKLKFRFVKKYVDFQLIPIQLYVKAVTYHQLSIKKDSNGVIINFFLDI